MNLDGFWLPLMIAGAVLLVGEKIPINTNECPGYETKLSDNESPIQELWGMWNTTSFPFTTYRKYI